MKKSWLTYRSELCIVSDSADILDFRPGHPLHQRRQRVDVVQATRPFPEWCHDSWVDIYLPIHIIRFLLDRFGGEGLLIRSDNGTEFSDIDEYEKEIEEKVCKATECSSVEYGQLLDWAEIAHVDIGSDVEVFMYPTYDRQPPYSDAIVYALCVKSYTADDYCAMATELAEYLSASYAVRSLTNN